MEIKLKRKNRFIEEVVYDTIANTIKLPSSDLPHKSLGMYDIVDGIFLALYKSSKNTLSMVINAKNFPIDEYFSIKYYENPLNSMAFMQVQYKADQLSISYDVKNMHPVSSIYYSEIMEDVNFGLWLSNVLNSSERKEIFISGW